MPYFLGDFDPGSFDLTMCVHSSLGVTFHFGKTQSFLVFLEHFRHQRNQTTSDVGKFLSVSFHSCLLFFDQNDFSVHGATRVWALRHKDFETHPNSNHKNSICL